MEIISNDSITGLKEKFVFSLRIKKPNGRARIE